MHTITYNAALRAIEITVQGFWEPEHLDDFRRDLAAAIVDYGRPTRSLYNFTEATIQPQVVVQRMQDMASSRQFNGRRVALYTEGCLARLQAKRVADAGSNMRVFQNRADAIAWLTEGDIASSIDAQVRAAAPPAASQVEVSA